jgi:hypothetical protein
MRIALLLFFLIHVSSGTSCSELKGIYSGGQCCSNPDGNIQGCLDVSVENLTVTGRLNAPIDINGRASCTCKRGGMDTSVPKALVKTDSLNTSYPLQENGAFYYVANARKNDSVPDYYAAYPALYGFGCHAWDEGLGQVCGGVDPKNWCLQPWCWVDETNCDMENTQSKYFEYANASMFYSYSTCDAQDMFTTTFTDD